MSNDFRFVEKLANSPWMCQAGHVEFMYSIFLRYLDRTAKGEKLDVRAIEQTTGVQLENTRTVTIRDGVARIPVEGTIMRRASLFTAMSGGVTTEQITKDFVSAYNNDSVDSILFVFDSPGGEAHGINELASLIREKRDTGSKRIEAYCDGLCASAAYWIASATHKITTDPTASVGSIGVVTRVRNPEVVKEQGDLEFWNRRSPNKRVDPTTEEGASTIQKHVDDLGDHFIAEVASNRGVDAETVEHEFGGGFVLTGKRALGVGMVDALGSEETAIQSLISRRRQSLGLVAASTERPLVASGVSSNTNLLGAPTLTDAIRFQDVPVMGVIPNFDPAREGDGMEEEQSQATQEEAQVEEQEARGVLAAVRRIVWPPEWVQAAQDVATDDAVMHSNEDREEKDIEMSEETQVVAEGADALADASADAPATNESYEALKAEERVELERLRAERAESEAERVRLQETLRAKAIDAMLGRYANVQSGDGKTHTIPPAQRNAASTLINAFVDAGVDVVSVDASGNAELVNNPSGRAIANLITPWTPIQLGEGGTSEGQAESGGSMGDHEKIMAVLNERGLGVEQYETVAGELAVKGEIRKEA